MLGVFAEFETDLRRERQLEGIAKAKKAGVYKGGKSGTVRPCTACTATAGSDRDREALGFPQMHAYRLIKSMEAVAWAKADP